MLPIRRCPYPFQAHRQFEDHSTMQPCAVASGLPGACRGERTALPQVTGPGFRVELQRNVGQDNWNYPQEGGRVWALVVVCLVPPAGRVLLDQTGQKSRVEWEHSKAELGASPDPIEETTCNRPSQVV